MKKNILTIAILASIGVSHISFASPYSSWEEEKEYRHNNVTVYKADVESLPYDELVHKAYSDKKENNHELQMQIARSFETGKFEVPTNEHEAMRWYNQAALNGNPHAAYKLYKYSVGKGSKAEEVGYEWLKFAAEQNHVDAVYEIGNNKFKNLQMSDEELNEVIEHFQRADSLGHPDAKNQIDRINNELRKRDNGERWNNFWKPFTPAK